MLGTVIHWKLFESFRTRLRNPGISTCAGVPIPNQTIPNVKCHYHQQPEIIINFKCRFNKNKPYGVEHTYVLNEFLTADCSCTIKYFWQNLSKCHHNLKKQTNKQNFFLNNYRRSAKRPRSVYFFLHFFAYGLFKKK